MFMPSGPVGLLFEMANCTCVAVSCISSIGRVLIVWSMCLLILFVLYGVMFVNCLLTLSMWKDVDLGLRTGSHSLFPITNLPSFRDFLKFKN